MLIQPIFTAILFALFFTLLFSLMFKKSGPWGSWMFFLVLFMALWAGGLWIYPAGPYVSGVAWLPIFFMGLFLALILIAVEDHSKRSTPPGKSAEEKERPLTVNEKQQRDAIATSFVFWTIMVILIIAIISGYLLTKTPMP